MLLVDTSAWVEALRRDGDPALRSAVQEALIDGQARTATLDRIARALEGWSGK